MKNKFYSAILILSYLILLTACRNNHSEAVSLHVRPLVDTIGFAHYPWQVDSIMARIGRNGWERTDGTAWKTAICPHDDYTYVGALYPEILCNIKADNLILIGVAHKARTLGIEDSLVFDSFSEWKGPFGNVPVSSARNELFEKLQNNFSVRNDTLQKVEHSLEALIPFLQYFNRNITIIPILVPAMSAERMEQCGKELAMAIKSVAEKHNWIWGKDYAIIVTTDAVHYGNEDWGGADYSYFGCNENGNKAAIEHENKIVSNCFLGEISPKKIRLFNQYTLDSADFHNYKWTWCGRYSLPVAMYTTYFLSSAIPLSGRIVGYSTSITGKSIPVDDLWMGRTAIATSCHWVGYVAAGYW